MLGKVEGCLLGNTEDCILREMLGNAEGCLLSAVGG